MKLRKENGLYVVTYKWVVTDKEDTATFATVDTAFNFLRTF